MIKNGMVIFLNQSNNIIINEKLCIEIYIFFLNEEN
jgi:hypothetical protein